ncbi:MAG: STAS domain-containing protein [Actinomycetota bacterium]
MELLRNERPALPFRLEGEIDLAVEAEVRAALDKALESGTRIVDASGVTFMDSTGLQLLLSAAAKLNGTGPLVLLRPSPSVRRVLDLALPDGAPGIDVRDA